MYIIGISLSGVLVATCMQPTIPVFTAMIAVCLGLEAGSIQKFLGIGLAVAGSVSMVTNHAPTPLCICTASTPHTHRRAVFSRHCVCMPQSYQVQRSSHTNSVAQTFLANCNDAGTGQTVTPRNPYMACMD